MADPSKDFLPIAVAEQRAKPTPEQKALHDLFFYKLRPDQRIELIQQWTPHKAIPGSAIRRMIGMASLRDTTESGLA